MSAVVTSAAPFVTDERLAHFAAWASLLIAGLLVLAYVWADSGQPQVDGGEGDDELAPSTAPDIASLEALRRASDRG